MRQLLHTLELDFLRERERDGGFGWQDDFFIAGKGRTTRTSASSCCCADGGTFATSSECSNDSAKGGAASGDDGCAFPLPFLIEGLGIGLDRQVITVKVDGCELQDEIGAAGKFAKRHSTNKDSVDARATRNTNFIARHDVCRNGAVKRLASFAELRSERET